MKSEVKIGNVYYDGRRLEPGEPVRGSMAAQINAVKILLEIARRITGEKQDEPRPIS